MELRRQARSRRNLICGGIFVAIAAGFAWEATHYQMGTPLRMGPGFMPMLLSGILATFGSMTIIAGFRTEEAVETAPIPWRGAAFILLALAIFGAFGRQLGLLPLVFVCTTLTAMASQKNTIVSALAIAACMTVLCYLVFKIGLDITLPSFGSLFFEGP